MFVVWVGLGFAGGGKPRPYHPNTQPMEIARGSRRGGVHPLPWGLDWIGLGVRLVGHLVLEAGLNPALTKPEQTKQTEQTK